VRVIETSAAAAPYELREEENQVAFDSSTVHLAGASDDEAAHGEEKEMGS
jgi:hypothetical protein